MIDLCLLIAKFFFKPFCPAIPFAREGDSGMACAVARFKEIACRRFFFLFKTLSPDR